MNITTIDFDIIMAPDINLYNDWIEGEEVEINDFIKEHSLLNNLKADFNIYEYITHFLLKAIKKLNADDIYFIKSHETLTKYVRGKYNFLYNIDHHHDITYDLEEDIKVPLISCGCGNWVKYLMDNKTVSHYTWIHNENSDYPPSEINIAYPHRKKLLQEYNVEDLAAKTDKLFICQSPEWIPSYLLPLFDIWINICEEFFNKPFKII